MTSTTITADRAYLAARSLLGTERAGHPFVVGAEAARERADQILNASMVLAPETGAEAREQLRIATQDLIDVSDLMAHRVEAAGTLLKAPDEIVARYAAEYHAAIEAWRDAMDVVIAGTRP
jgi:Mg2+/Co2+ transporter CorB